jgi:hypothetical protein
MPMQRDEERGWEIAPTCGGLLAQEQEIEMHTHMFATEELGLGGNRYANFIHEMFARIRARMGIERTSTNTDLFVVDTYYELTRGVDVHGQMPASRQMYV